MKTRIFQLSDSDFENIEKLKALDEIKKHFASEKITSVGLMRLALNDLFIKFGVSK